MAKVTREEMVAEAVARMKMLKIHKNAINEFEKEGKLNRSERMKLGGMTFGCLYWLDEDQLEKVRDWEHETNNIVYHVVQTFTTFGEILDCLYVSRQKSEWEADREDIKDGTPYVYSINVNDPWCSEIGTIGIEPAAGGLIRTF